MPRGEARVIDFETDEGTWMSVDVAPDGRRVAFDLLGHIYLMGIEGGKAQALTQDSGMALNFHPTFSPDGSRIAFISDRGGQNALWVMDADGRNARLLFQDDETRIAEPAWLPDGKHIAAVRAFPTPGRGWHRQNTRVWLFPVDGKDPERELVGGKEAQYNGPSPSPNGDRIYFHTSYFSGNRYGTQIGHHVQSVALSGAELRDVIGSPPAAPDLSASEVPGNPSADIQPRVSPDGRWLAFARRMSGTHEQIAGHRLAGSTGLWIRNLATGHEQLLLAPITRDLSSAHAMYSHRVLPGFSWTPDSRAIILSVGGKIARVDLRSRRLRSIPFTAHVHRRISGQVRGRLARMTNSLPVKFLRWPASSPTDDRIAFVAVGKVWTGGGEGKGFHPVAPDVPGVQLTPSWSASGDALVFANWETGKRGGVWIKEGANSARRIALPAGEYIFPTFSPDGKSIVAMRGQSDEAAAGRWEAGKWDVVRFPVAGGDGVILATAAAARPVYFLADGRLAFERQEQAAAAQGLYQPFPSADAYDAKVSIVAQRPDPGAPQQRIAAFPARNSRAFGAGNRPLLSPDGRWVAFEAAREVYIAPANWSAEGTAPFIETNPNQPSPDARRVSRAGGVYPRWQRDGTLEFVSGRTLFSCTADNLICRERDVELSVPRPVPNGAFALVGAKIISLGSKGVIERGTLVVEGDRIRCIGRCTLRKSDKIIDATGKTIIPGLIDVHTHDTEVPEGVVPSFAPELARQLAYGVTTTVDPASDAAAILPLAELSDAGFLAAPRIYGVGDLVTSGRAAGFGDHVEIRSLADAERIARRNAEWGAVALKSFRLTSRRQMQQLTEGARRAGLSITAEGGPIEYVIGMAMDGQTGWEHYIANLPVHKDVSTFLGQANMVYSPTSGVSGHPRGGVDFFRDRHDFASDEKYRRFSAAGSLPAPIGAAGPTGFSAYSFPIVASGLAAIRAAGGRGAIGEHSEQGGIGSHWEIWSYATALAPIEALKVATIEGAYFHGLDQEIGSLEVGKLADLVILNRNPLENIRHTLDIAFVAKGGILYRAADLEPIWPVRKPDLQVFRTHD
jgi:Tol biopolymer transport system component/imidazolonepropionase-like amidohydrolase